MTRHLKATQCLSSAEGRPFWMLLAQPETQGQVPDASAAWLLKVNPGEGIKLRLGTRHAGPLFVEVSASSFNLEFADTNQIDHETLPLSDAVKMPLNQGQQSLPLPKESLPRLSIRIAPHTF